MDITAAVIRTGLGHNNQGREVWNIKNCGVGSLNKVSLYCKEPENVDAIHMEGNYLRTIDTNFKLFSTLRILDLQ